jgi:DNA-binding GntR family transcriptional regulator
MDDVRPDDGETLSDYAYRRICAALIAGQFDPGEKMTIRGMAEMFEISPTPIREAFRRLAAENAVDFAPNRYIRVPLLSAGELRQLRDIRCALEGMAVEQATRRIGKAQLADLHRREAEIVALREQGDVRGIIRAIQAMHFAMYRPARSAHLMRMIESLWLRTAPYVSLLFPEYSRREKGNLRRMILEAIAERDGAAAAHFLRADITGAMNHICAKVAERQDDGAG